MGTVCMSEISSMVTIQLQLHMYASEVITVSVSFLDEHSCEFGSGKYYAYCAFGGLLSCGLTHTAVVPLDLVKCRIQVSTLGCAAIILYSRSCSKILKASGQMHVFLQRFWQI